MAAAHGLPTPAASSRRSSTAPVTPKLRDSCHACASSKLKCGKEKPTCSRCAKRGLACEYVATRRGGRKQDSRSSASNSIKSHSDTISTDPTNHALPPLSNWFSPNSATSTTEAVSSTGVVQPSFTPTTSAPSSTLFSDFDFPLDPSLTSTLDDFSSSPASFSMPMVTDAEILGQPQFFSTDLDSSSSSSTTHFDAFPIFEDSISELFTLSQPQSPPSNLSSSNNDPQNQQTLPSIDLSCSCLIRALGLMKQLSPSHSIACTISPIQISTDSTALTSIKTVIAKNEHTMEAVSSMLDCSCSQDGYLLVIMSLIIFKVLGCYADAASGKTAGASPPPPIPPPASGRQTPLKAHSRQVSLVDLSTIATSSSSSGQNVESEDSARMSAQLVLSELHRVQRFVNQLSTKLKARAAKMDGAAATDASDYESSDSEMALPLSALMLEQFEVDLRKRLRGLSLKIVEGLRER